MPAVLLLNKSASAAEVSLSRYTILNRSKPLSPQKFTFPRRAALPDLLSRVVYFEYQHGDVVGLRGFAAPVFNAAEDFVPRFDRGEMRFGFHQLEQAVFTKLFTCRVHCVDGAVSVREQEVAGTKLKGTFLDGTILKESQHRPAGFQLHHAVALWMGGDFPGGRVRVQYEW